MNRENAEKISQIVVEILEQKRIANKITKLKISKDTGLSRTAITLIANKQNSPTLRTLLMISSSIGVDIKEVINEAEKMLKNQ